MSTLKFADTHNMVAFLSKPKEREGFEQIVDFLNANPIKYALTINPTIYTSCIEQFWATVKAKTVNGEVQLQALVDGKKVIITESTVRRDLHLEDAEGVDCLPNATIFEQLTLMGYEKLSQKLTFYKAFFSPQWKFLIHMILQCLSAKTTSWNEFSSTMASAIICLATNQKFNFSKYIFKSMVKNLENVSAQEEIDEGLAMPTDPYHTTTIIQPSTSQPQKTHKPRRLRRKVTEVPQPSGSTINVADEAGTSSGSGPKSQDTMGDTISQTRSENVSKLSNDPLLARVESSEESLGEEDASKQGRIDDIDDNEDIYLVNVHRDEDMFGVNDLEGDEVVIETEVASKDVNLSVDEVTLAQALAALKSAKPKADKAKGLVIHEEEQATTPTVSSQQPSQVKVQDKGKGIEKPVKRLEQIRLDEELALKLQAEEEEEEEERLAREKA
ncbi:hypothetical protein Tco_1312436 [Tanacetum coccineum]